MNIPIFAVNLVYRILEEALATRIAQYDSLKDSNDYELKTHLDHEIRALIQVTTVHSIQLDEEHKPKKEEKNTENPFTWTHEDSRRW